MQLALETRSLSKAFGDFVAVDRIDLAVPQGSFYGFLGPNGAGKSTTIKCLTGLLEPSSGSISVLGLDPGRHEVEVKRQLGVVPEDLALFDYLTAVETLSFTGRVHGLERAVIAARSDELLELLGLAEDEGAVVSDFSHGMRKKLALAVALLPRPRLLFLDEPFEGIDAVASRLVRQILESFVASGGTVFLTSHILEIVERLCDRLGVIAHGRLVAQGTTTELQAGGPEGRSLEDLFLSLIGATQSSTPRLTWLLS